MEIEVKILNIDPQEIRAKLSAAGCTQTGYEFQQNRMYDFHDRRLYEQEDGSYIRIRQMRDLATGRQKSLLTLKKTVSRDQFKIADETETLVDDPEMMESFLLKLGFVRIRIDEKIRETWQMPGLHFEIDEWAGMPPYLEVEAADQETVTQGLALLGFSMQDTTAMNLREVLALYKIESDSLQFKDFGRKIPGERQA